MCSNVPAELPRHLRIVRHDRLVGEAPTMQQVYAGLLSSAVHPVLKEAGFTRKGRRLWWRGNPDIGWVLIDAVSDKYNNWGLVTFTVMTTVWPPGTWEYELRRGEVWRRLWGDEPAPPPPLPFAGDNAPMSLTPADLDPDNYRSDPGRGDHWWELGARTDLDAFAAELASFVGRVALPWAQANQTVEGAVQYLTSSPPPAPWIESLAFACAILAHHNPADPRLADTVQRLTDLWVPDPRPLSVRPFIVEWRDVAGLPQVWLPTRFT